MKFWHWHFGAIKIRLTEGRSLTWQQGGTTEEGYYHEVITWTLEDGIVSRVCREDSRDCDGRVENYCEHHCPADRLHAGHVDETEPLVSYPDWGRGTCGQRDYAAEAMGY